MAILWLIEWALLAPRRPGVGPNNPRGGFQWASWPGSLVRWLTVRPTRWLILAVALFIGSTLISTALSTSYGVSLWGDVPGQDSYSAYTVICYGLLFAVIATHLKTEAQLWRLLGAIVLMGVLAAGYAVFQHYHWDFLDLTEPFGHTRSTSSFGRTVFAGAVLVMTIPVTIVVAAKSLTGSMSRSGFALRLAVSVIVLSVQILGTIFIASRGPWVGTLAGLATLLVLVTVFVGWRQLGRVALVLALGLVVSVVVVVSPLQSIADKAAERQSETLLLGDFKSLGGAEVTQRFASIGSQAAIGGLSGRREIWDNSWELVTERPWFEFDDLSLSFLRPLIGYGPEMFRATYLLSSPPNPAQNHLPNEASHAHNFFLHQGVETGFLGLLATAGLYIAVFAVAAYLWVRYRSDLSAVHKLVLAGLLATLVGRGLEQMVGVSRVSDLMMLWVLLAVYAALPIVFTVAASQNRQARRRRTAPPQARISTSFLKWGSISPQWWTVARVSLVAALIVGISLLTWFKTIDYVRAAVIADAGAKQFRDGHFQEALASLYHASNIAPDVSTYYQHIALSCVSDQVTQSIQQSNQLCDARQNYLRYQEWFDQRQFDYRSRMLLSDSLLNLGFSNDDQLLFDEAIQRLEEAAQMAPNSFRLWNRLAERYLRVGRPEEALSAIEKTLKLTEGSSFTPDILVLQGRAYRSMGRYKEMHESFDRALELSPAAHPVHFERGVYFFSQREFRQSLPALDQAIELSPNSANYYYIRGNTYYELGRIRSAIEDYSVALILDPQLVDAYNFRGLSYIKLELYETAVKDFDRAINKDLMYALAFNNRGLAHRELGELDQSIVDLNQAIQLDPEFALAYYNRALARILQNNDVEAELDGNRAVELGFDPTALRESFEAIRSQR